MEIIESSLCEVFGADCCEEGESYEYIEETPAKGFFFCYGGYDGGFRFSLLSECNDAQANTFRQFLADEGIAVTTREIDESPYLITVRA